MSKKFGSLLLLTIVIVLVVMAYRYIHFRTTHAVSDAAFIKSDRLAILSFKVGGKVVAMNKEPNVPVKKGKLLARIDPVDFVTVKEELEHKRKALEKKIEATRLKKRRLEESLKLRSDLSREDVTVTKESVAALALKIEAAKVQLAQLKRDAARLAALLSRRLIGREKYEQLLSKREELAKSIEAMERELLAGRAKLDKAKTAYRLSLVNEKQIAELSKSIQAMQEQFQALGRAIEALRHKIAYSNLYAPFDGMVAKKFFDAPRVVKKGSPVYALTDPKALYCEVLLSEKKMKGVQAGNTVEISIDALDGQKFEGEVESIAPTSASTFSLVPRDIASGEFTKLDQRFVVRIRLKELDPHLRAGMGATVSITRSRN
jgi:membrane fusion protein (multidrug efflux system)